jgi:TonB-dependent SusC/RagA subfamily outer membrane receptor
MLAIAVLVAHAGLGAQQAVPRGTATPSQSITLTSDLTTAVVDANDSRQVAQGVRSVIASQVAGVDVVDDSTGSHLRIGAASIASNFAPLFVIDGVPLADGFALRILTRSLERIDVFRDSASTAPYGFRAAHGVVLIATAKPR